MICLLKEQKPKNNWESNVDLSQNLLRYIETVTYGLCLEKTLNDVHKLNPTFFNFFFFLLLKRKHHLRLKWSWSDKCQTTQPSIQDYPGYPKPPSVYSSFGFVLVLGGLCTLYKRNLLRLTIWDVPKSWIRGINEVDVGKLISIISFYLYSLFRCWDKKKCWNSFT